MPSILAAVDSEQLAVPEMTMAIADIVAGAVRRHQQGVVPVRIKQRRQGMGFMVIVEMDRLRFRQADELQSPAGIDHVFRRTRPCSADFRRQPAHRLSPNVSAIGVPPPGRLERCIGKIHSADGDCSDIAGLGADNRQHFVDAAIGKFRGISLNARQPLKLDGRLECVVLEHHRAGIMKSRMKPHNQF